MKIESRAVGRALQDVLKWRAVLLYGDDHGLIRERATQCIRLAADTPDDPFRVALLMQEHHARLAEEMSALSLVGGRRGVWVREGNDELLPQIKNVLAYETDTLLVIEAPHLPTRSKLRAALEAHPAVATIGCYPEEGEALVDRLADMLARESVSISREGLQWLVGVLGADRSAVRQEVEKLILYAGPGGALTLADLQECIGDGAASSLDDVVSAAFAGDRALADRMLERAIDDGLSAVALARACLYTLTRLLTALRFVAGGKTRHEAMRLLKPPVFFKKTKAFEAALRRWDQPALLRVCSATQKFELACKQTGSPDLTLSRRLIAQICHGPRAFLRR